VGTGTGFSLHFQIVCAKRNIDFGEYSQSYFRKAPIDSDVVRRRTISTIRHGFNTGMGMADRTPKKLATIMHSDRFGMLDDSHVVNLPDSADTFKHESKFPKRVPRFDRPLPHDSGNESTTGILLQPQATLNIVAWYGKLNAIFGAATSSLDLRKNSPQQCFVSGYRRPRHEMKRK
jgi:hypothetical protein